MIINEILQKLKIISTQIKGVVFNEIEFEKDNDKNGHIDFISHVANFRAENYAI